MCGMHWCCCRSVQVVPVYTVEKKAVWRKTGALNAQAQATVHAHSWTNSNTAVNSNLAIHCAALFVSPELVCGSCNILSPTNGLMTPVQGPISSVLGAVLLFQIYKKVVLLLNYDVCDNWCSQQKKLVAFFFLLCPRFIELKGVECVKCWHRDRLCTCSSFPTNTPLSDWACVPQHELIPSH